MKSLGLTEYEAKAYLALLAYYPVNGYALSKKSDIPRSRIYEILDGLVKKQVVFQVEEGKGSAYSPLEPRLLMDKLRQRFDASLLSVEAYASQLYNGEGDDFEPKVLRGQEEIFDMIKALIRDPKHRVVLSLWDDDLRRMMPELASAEKKVY